MPAIVGRILTDEASQRPCELRLIQRRNPRDCINSSGSRACFDMLHDGQSNCRLVGLFDPPRAIGITWSTWYFLPSDTRQTMQMPLCIENNRSTSLAVYRPSAFIRFARLFCSFALTFSGLFSRYFLATKRAASGFEAYFARILSTAAVLFFRCRSSASERSLSAFFSLYDF